MMSEVHFPDLSIKGFRGFRNLSMSQLGRVTLITGKNNTGKSSVLEALRLHAQDAAPSTIHDILAFREEHTERMNEDERSYDLGNGFPISALFHGFPRLSEDFGPIVISTSGKLYRMDLTIHIGWAMEERGPDGIRRRLVHRQPTLFGESELIPVLTTETQEGEKIRTLESFRRYAHLGRRSRFRPDESYRMPCILVSPYSGEETYALGTLWDEISLTDNEKFVVEALRIIDPRISAISMVGGEESPRTRRAIVRADHITRPVPLRSFGDGLNRLFAIVLSLVNARGGLLLIDEFENGLHHTVQFDAWRMIYQLAQSLDVQVFATSHSWDAVEAFQKAAAEAPEDGALLRLTRRDDDIIPTVFTESELAIATRDRIEIR